MKSIILVCEDAIFDHLMGFGMPNNWKQKNNVRRSLHTEGKKWGKNTRKNVAKDCHALYSGKHYYISLERPRWALFVPKLLKCYTPTVHVHNGCRRVDSAAAQGLRHSANAAVWEES
jgi:hypothetical protein